MKTGENTFPLKLANGTTVQGAYASQVEYILVEHENKSISPRRFKVVGREWQFKCAMKLGDEEVVTDMKGFQFPIISNSCTTGHKLQGSGLDELYVNDWLCEANWVYVILSRVRTLNGLYLQHPLSEDLSKYAKPPEMKAMLKHFRDTVAVSTLSDREYDNLSQNF